MGTDWVGRMSFRNRDLSRNSVDSSARGNKDHPADTGRNGRFQGLHRRYYIGLQIIANVVVRRRRKGGARQMKHEVRAVKSSGRNCCSNCSSDPIHIGPPWIGTSTRSSRTRNRPNTKSGSEKGPAQALAKKSAPAQDNASRRV